VAVNSQSIAHEIVPAPMITASVPDVPTIIDDITHGVPIPTAIVSKIKFIDDVASESPIYDIVNSSKGSTPTIEHVFVLPPETGVKYCNQLKHATTRNMPKPRTALLRGRKNNEPDS
jgi:hypothetical protein